MADQESRLAALFNLTGREVGELLDQVGPVAGDGVARVVAEFVDGLDLEAAGFEALEHRAVSTARKTVAVGKNDQRFC
jgi:hypothetical protein